MNYFKGNGIFLLQNDKTCFTYKHFESNPPSTVNTVKFDCLDLSGPGCMYITYSSTCTILSNDQKYYLAGLFLVVSSLAVKFSTSKFLCHHILAKNFLTQIQRCKKKFWPNERLIRSRLASKISPCHKNARIPRTSNRHRYKLLEYSYLSNKRRVANKRRVWKKYQNLIN